MTNSKHVESECENKECLHAVVNYVDENFRVILDKLDTKLSTIEKAAVQNAVDSAAFRASVEAWREQQDENAAKLDSLLEEHSARLISLETSRDRAATAYKVLAWMFGAAITVLGVWKTLSGVLAHR